MVPPRRRRRRHGSQQGHRPRDRRRPGRQRPPGRRRRAERGAREGRRRGHQVPRRDEGRGLVPAVGRVQRRLGGRFCEEPARGRARGR